MAEQRVVVEADLGVEADELAILGDDERVHFEQAHVLLGERAVEPGEHLAHLLLQIAIQPKRFRNAQHMVRADVGCRIDREGQDLLGRVVRHLLDIHAAFGRNHDRDPRGHAVDQHREIELPGDRRAFLDVEAIDLLALRAGLMSDQRRAQDSSRLLLHIIDRLDHLDAAGLAAAAGMDLRLDHDDGRREISRRLGSLVD